MNYQNYALGKWITGDGEGIPLYNAITGEEIGKASSNGLDYNHMMLPAREVGGPAPVSYTHLTLPTKREE